MPLPYDPLLQVRSLGFRAGEGCPHCPELTGPEAETNMCPRCRTVWACRDVDLDLFPGEVLGIVGESGSGKSTLLRILALEQTASEGVVHLRIPGDVPPPLRREDFDGKDILALSPFHRRLARNHLLGIVHQNPHLGLLLDVSAGGNIADKLLSAGWRNVANMRARAAELLRRTEVPVNRMDEPPRRFSGGMQQRVQIAKALSNGPMVLFLDELTTGLDVSVQARVLDLVRRLQGELGIAMLVVSHDLGVIRLLTKRTVVMRHGRVVESGLTDQILEDPQHPYTQLMVSSVL